MDFILNSKTKKVEIFYENAAEQQAILNFMSQYLTYREDKTSPSVYINNPGIVWDTAAIATTDPGYTNPYTITSNIPDISISLDSVCDTLSSNSTTYTDLEKNVSSAIVTSIQPKEKKAYAAAKLDNASDEGGYSCLTAYVPRPSKKK